MAKNEIGDYDETDANNTDISGLPVTNATLIAQLDDIIRAEMGALKRWFRTSLFRLRDSSDQTKLLAFDLSGLTTATTRTLAAPDASGTIALVTSLTQHGQCRIALTGGNIVLSPFGGNGLRIAGVLYAIPSAGVSLVPGALATATDLNVYAYMSGATMTLEAATTAHAADTAAGNIGVRIKSGDNTRTLVGKVRLAAGPVFVDSATQRFVLNWFNRQAIGTQNGFTADRTTANGTFVEVNSEIRCEFLTWADDAVTVALAGVVANDTAGRGVVSTIAVDGNAEPVAAYGVSASNNADNTSSVTLSRTMSEGYHYYTVFGRTDGVGTARWRSAAATNGRTLLSTATRG